MKHDWAVYNNIILILGCLIKYYLINQHRRNNMLNRLFIWLFSEEERKPISFIITFFLIIIISVAVSLFIVAIDRHVQGWVGYLFP